MDYQRIEKYSVITLLVCFVCLILFSQPMGLGFLLGGLSSLLAFKHLQKLEYVPLEDLKYLRKSLSRNKLIRMLIYALAFLVCFFYKDTFNFIACFFGLLLVRTWVMFVGGKVYD